MKKQVDPNETYEIHEMIACEDGHFWAPGFTHIEEGECCPFGNHEGDPHLYYRKIMVPVEASDGGSLWAKITSVENAGKYGWLPVAP